MRRKLAVVGAALALLAVTAAGLAVAAAGDDEPPLTGARLERATAAALEHTGGGAVVETEVSDDGAAYGVEVRLRSGRVVEVALDESFAVVASEIDEDAEGERDDDSGEGVDD